MGSPNIFIRSVGFGSIHEKIYKIKKIKKKIKKKKSPRACCFCLNCYGV
jgi:cystathionine beta-lyase family protein involved in aluminum resistance